MPALLDNPVITKELRGRMRGTRTYWLLFGYLLTLSLILFFSYLGWWAQHAADMQSGGNAAGFTVGRNFFKILFYSQAVMMALITPALTAGAITVEREQRTFEMLRGTILRPGAVVWGKLASSVSFVALLLTSSLPLLSLCFLLGGVSPGEVFFAYILLIGDAFLFGAIGLCWSAYAGGTATATVLSYVTLIVFFVATFPFAISTLDDNGYTPNFGLCSVNPIGAVTGAVVPEHYYGWTLPAWLPALLLNGTLTALLILAAINRLEDFPARRAAGLRAVTLLFVGLLIFFGNGVVEGLPPMLGVSSAVQLEVEIIVACVLLLLIVPVIVTGDLETEPEQQKKSVVKSLGRVFSRASLPSGLPLALLLTVIAVGGTFGAAHFGSLLSGQHTVAVQNFGNRIGRSTAFAPPIPQIDAIVQRSGVLLTALVFGISGLGFLLSVLLNNRWSSLTLLYLALIFAVTLPFFSYATLAGRDATAALHDPAINSLYLCPLIPVWQLTDSLSPRPLFGHDSVIPGMIGYGKWPLWVGSTVVYLIVGLASYAVGIVFLRRRKITRSI